MVATKIREIKECIEENIPDFHRKRPESLAGVKCKRGQITNKDTNGQLTIGAVD